jgi:hypothetical protein
VSNHVSDHGESGPPLVKPLFKATPAGSDSQPFCLAMPSRIDALLPPSMTGPSHFLLYNQRVGTARDGDRVARRVSHMENEPGDPLRLGAGLRPRRYRRSKDSTNLRERTQFRRTNPIWKMSDRSVGPTIRANEPNFDERTQFGRCPTRVSDPRFARTNPISCSARVSGPDDTGPQISTNARERTQFRIPEHRIRSR